MDTIGAAAASGMRARMESLEMLANNLANTETGGYKGDREFYSLFTGADATTDTRLPVIESHWTDFAQGDLRVTSNQLDFAIEGDGLFAVNTARGVRYTRNGNFRVSPAGTLTTADGAAVRGKGGAAIQVPPGGVVDPKQLELVAFDRAALNKEAGNYFAPAEGVKPKAAKGEILQGKLESSNVNTAESAVRLVAIMRQFEMLQKAATIGAELGKASIEQVAHVTT